MTNSCVYDCSYCLNRKSNDIPRASFTPEELADLTINFYKRNYIEGLFLSSGVVRNADYTMELLIRTVKLLRYKYMYGGYIHVKIIPGASDRLVEQMNILADRVSSNIELPSGESLKSLAPDKDKDKIIGSFKEVKKYTKERNEKAVSNMSTQLIVGATPESDSQIVKLSEAFYTREYLKRVYYSAYIPVNNDRNLPAKTEPPLLREHRLYQADWLLRFYGFTHKELFVRRENLDLRLDPKTVWAMDSLDVFPLDVNYADKEVLLRIPGIGHKSVFKILRARKQCYLRPEDLKKMGVSLKRARYFLKFRHGSLMDNIPYQREDIERSLLSEVLDKNMRPVVTVPELLGNVTGEI
jgi:putative DNA modification/repair radical SAM protein